MSRFREEEPRPLSRSSRNWERVFRLTHSTAIAHCPTAARALVKTIRGLSRIKGSLECAAGAVCILHPFFIQVRLRPEGPEFHKAQSEGLGKSAAHPKIEPCKGGLTYTRYTTVYSALSGLGFLMHRLTQGIALGFMEPRPFRPLTGGEYEE